MAELTDTSETSPTIQSGPSTSLDNLEKVSTSVPESAQGICNNVLGGEGNGSVRDTQTSEVASNNEGSLVASEQTSQVASEQTSQVASGQTSQVASGQTSQVASEQTSQGEQATTDIQVPNLATPAIQVTTNDNDETLDMKAMQEQIHSLSKELDEKKKESDTFKQMFQEERQRSSDSARLLKLKSQSLQEERERSLASEAELQQSLEEERQRFSDLEHESQAREIETNKLHDNYHELLSVHGRLMMSQEEAVIKALQNYRPPFCTATTKDGTVCQRYAKIHDLCIQHDKKLSEDPQ